ncbi:MAG: transglutaminaseTgpA domain-containing protein, partial [Acidimicrobiia bacterium]
MVFRLTWLASFSLLALVILRLTRLFLPSESGLPWQVVVVVAAALGATVTWAATKARFGPIGLILSHVSLFLIFGYLYLGGELSDTTIPPLEVLSDIPSELSAGLTIFRYSAPPVAPLAGVVVLSTMMVWALSAVATWGLLNNGPYLGIVPPVVFYLQLAVIDRQTTGMLWTATLLLLVGGGLATIAANQKATGGHTSHRRQRTALQTMLVPVLAIVAVTAVAVFGTRQAVEAELVPTGGVLDWTNRSGIGGGFGSVSYNPFIDVHRSLVSNSETPAFSASVTGDIAPDQVYWRLLTMDTYNAEGGYWFASRDELESLDETNWEDDEYEFRGAEVPLIQDVRISNLSSGWLPATYSPVSVFSENRLIANTTRVNPIDGSLHIDGVTGRNMTYRIQSLVPDVDSRVLAADDTGESLSPLFAAAAEDGHFPPVPAPAVSLAEPDDLDRYRDLPRDADPGGRLKGLAELLTLGLETDYEKTLALEHFFRDPELFSYSTTIAPEERDTDLTAWLLDPLSPGHREGYCEQFSASMGVLARLLDIPTRTVLGFTPGEVQQEDGSILVRDRNAHAWVEVWLPAQG